MSKKRSPNEGFIKYLETLVSEMQKAQKDMCAVLTGETPPSVAEWQSQIQEHWNDYSFIARGGHVYKLTNETRQKSNGAYYSPCDLCELKYECNPEAQRLCDIICAESDEYFYDAGELIINKKNMKIKPWY